MSRGERTSPQGKTQSMVSLRGSCFIIRLLVIYTTTFKRRAGKRKYGNLEKKKEASRNRFREKTLIMVKRDVIDVFQITIENHRKTLFSSTFSQLTPSFGF